MLKLLHEIADKAIQIPDNAGLAVRMELTRRRKQLEAQLSLARRAILMLRSLHADISALRVDDGDGFQGTGNCEFGHEGVDVTLDWPNLALLTDETEAALLAALSGMRMAPPASAKRSSAADRRLTRMWSRPTAV